MSLKFKKGEAIFFKYGSNMHPGKIKEIYTKKVTLTINHGKITRNATEDEPVYLIETESGSEALHSQSELKPQSHSTKIKA